MFLENRMAHTWIDLFLVNDSDSYSHYTKTNSPSFAGHDLIALKYKLPKPPNPLRMFTSRHLESVNVDSLHRALRDSLDTTNIDPRNRSDPIDSGAASFSDGVIRAFDAVAPCHVSTVRTHHKPWISIDIRDLMRERDRAYSRAKGSRRREDVDAFKRLRNEVKTRLNQAKPLNQHFAGIASTSAAFTVEDVLGVLSTRLDENEPVFDFSPVGLNELTAAINGAHSKAIGPDNISVKMIKMAMLVILQPLHDIINRCIETGIFPSVWLRTFVLPLAKQRTITDILQTRPIAKLCEVSKLCERLLHDQLSSYVETNHLLNPSQAGFRRGHSTHTALLAVLDDVRMSIEEGKITVLVLFDFTKAFDMVPHRTLLAKLRKLSFSDRSVQWFVYYSFLSHDLEVGVHRLNTDIAAVAAWATSNGLSLNVRKTKAIILASHPYYRQLDLQSFPRVALNSVELPYSAEVQCLGLLIQTGLDWSRQVGSASGRVYGVLHVLRRLHRLLSRQNRKELIETLVFPHLDYACAAYDDLLDYQNRLELGWLSVDLRSRYFKASIAYSLAQGTPSYLVKNFKLAVNSEIQRFSPRLPRRTLYYPPVDTAALQNSFIYIATDLINDLFPETILFDPRLISRTKQTIFSKLLAIDNDNSQIQI
uniref:Reverse transcriptase domain-containing protein n=1 Tax=Trichogramma kaykai TaxID=54128 RepID=A0ABD2X045_9HYME